MTEGQRNARSLLRPGTGAFDPVFAVCRRVAFGGHCLIRILQSAVDDAQDRGVKRFGILTLLLRQMPRVNERVDFRYV
jgi:hypothetical protein